MQFVELTGTMLMGLVDADQADQLREAGVQEKSRIRVNPQGDIEMFQHGNWNVIGGLLGDYKTRIKNLTGHGWE